MTSIRKLSNPCRGVGEFWYRGPHLTNTSTRSKLQIIYELELILSTELNGNLEAS